MEQKEKFLILGGDRRNVHLANIFANENFEVNSFGINSDELDQKVNKKTNLNDAFEGVDIIIGSLPLSLDNETLNCMDIDNKIYLKDIFKTVRKGQLFFAGYINEKVKQMANLYNVSLIDYFQREELMVLNCIPTAEGAIQIAMQELQFTIHGSNCLILGFGRVGKVLARILQAMGAKVCIEARKHSDLAWVKCCDYKGIHLNQLEEHLNKYDVIFNTIPSLILNEKLLKKVNKKSLIIDLASKPGGVDFETAKKNGIKVIWALSLPGKVAPYTAASIIKDTVFNIIDELGV